MLRFFTFIAITCSLIACQTTPPLTVAPVPVTDERTDGESTQSETLDPQQVLHHQAIKSTQDGDIDKAIEQFNAIIKNKPSAKNAYTNLGLLYLHKKNEVLAKEAFLNAINQNKNDAVAYNHLAIIQRQNGEFKLALFNYYKAINAEPEYANAHLNLGILLDIYLQDLPKALEQYVIFQKLTENKNETVEKWIADTKRRIESNKGK